MEKYVKPTVTGDNSKEGVFPAAVLVGMTMALSKGRTLIDANHTKALNKPAK